MCAKCSAPAIRRASPRALSAAAKHRPCNELCRDGEGFGVVAPNPPFVTYQPACKPGSVGHRQLAPTMRDGHSSGIALARDLEQPTRTASLTSLARMLSLAANCPPVPSLFGLAPGGVCHAGSVAGPAVRSYRTLSPLLAISTCSRDDGRFVLCGTFPGVAPAGRYPAPHVDGARTFLSRAPLGARERPSGRLMPH